MDRIVQQALLGDLALGDVGERADDADHLAVRADHGPGAHRVPEIMAVGGAQAEVLVDAAAPLLQHRVEAGAVAVALERVQHVEPAGGGAFQRAAADAKLRFNFRRDEDAVGGDVPVVDHVAAAGERQRLAARVGDRAGAQAAPREGVLHDREADQHDDQHEAADQRRRHEVVGQRTGHGEARADHPGEQQEPGRDQHDRAVVAVRREVEHQHEADAGDGGEGKPCDAGGDRRVEHREGDEGEQKDQPRRGDARGADVPAREVEVGEEEDEERRRQRGLGTGAPDAVAGARHAEQLVPEAEVDADVGEHGPGECRRGGEDHRALHDEDDGEEQRQQAGDADDDALVERQARHLVLVGVGYPQRELRQVRRAQLGDVGDGGAGIERQAEDVGICRVLVFRRDALARGDRRDAGGAEIGPDDAGADEAEMRGDDDAFELLVGVVRQREDDPVRAGAGILGADLDAADDAVGAGGGRDEQTVALGGIALDRLGEIDRRRVGRHAHRLDRARGKQARQQQEKRQEDVDEAGGKVHSGLAARGARLAGTRVFSQAPRRTGSGP